MRVWLYARLSNDDDREMNSLLNQREICQAFAEQHGYIIVGQSFDDNISGMSFDRRGLDELTAAVDADMIDAVIVKDLSRLGRHRTQTALFIDYLREHQVRVISATEGVDTFRDEDDLIIGVRGLMNDYYAKDIGKKIRAGYRQKQREGIVITPPFGYWKDKNTGQIKIDAEAAVTVQLIYSLYLQGCGQKEIARRLNAAGRKTPAQLRAERCGREVRHTHKTRDGQFLWTYTSVKNILVEEAYTGVLNNHRREYNNGKTKHIDKTDWYRHEGFFPVIIGKQEWEQVQRLLKQQARELAKRQGLDLVICDGSPGVGCPVISSLSGASLAVAVVEPTPSGRHDFERVAALCDHFRIPVAVLINKADLNHEEVQAITRLADDKGYTVVGALPFDPAVTGAMIRRKALTETDSPLASTLSAIWGRIRELAYAPRKRG